MTRTKCQEKIFLLDSYNKLTDFSLLLCTAVQCRLCVKKPIGNIAGGIKIPFWFLLSVDSCKIWVSLKILWIGSSGGTNNLT